MAIEQTATGSIVITGAASINFYRLAMLRSAMGLELKGVRVWRHTTAYTVIKREFGLKGNKQRVFEQFSAMVERLKANRGAVDTEQ